MPEQQQHFHSHIADAAVIENLAGRAFAPDKLDPEQCYGIVVPEGCEYVVPDIDDRLAQPKRATGIVRASTVEALLSYVGEHEDGGATTVWVQDATNPMPGIAAPDGCLARIIGVINDHEPGAPGWGDHRAVLDLYAPPAWQRWAEHNGQMLDQLTFAELIEDSLHDIASPPGAELLEIAQSIEATTQASFRSARRLDSGQVGIAYNESIEARAGQTGELQIPQQITLRLAPFPGEGATSITARLRYRIREGTLRLGYRLDRPDEVIREAIEGIAERLGKNLGRVYLGTPRPPRS